MKITTFLLILLFIGIQQESFAQENIEGFWIEKNARWEVTENSNRQSAFTSIINFSKNGEFRVAIGNLYKSRSNYTFAFEDGYALAKGQWKNIDGTIHISFEFVENTSKRLKVVKHRTVTNTIKLINNELIIDRNSYKKLKLRNIELVDVGKVFSNPSNEDKQVIKGILEKEKKKDEELKRLLRGE